MKRRHRGVGEPQAVDVSPCRPRRGVEVWGPMWYSLVALGILVSFVTVFSLAMVSVIWGDRAGQVLGMTALIASLIAHVWYWWLREVCGDC